MFKKNVFQPLPEKHSLRRLERFSPEFVKTRQVALQKFLSRIADHPVISYNKHFLTFLTAKQWVSVKLCRVNIFICMCLIII